MSSGFHPTRSRDSDRNLNCTCPRNEKRNILHLYVPLLDNDYDGSLTIHLVVFDPSPVEQRFENHNCATLTLPVRPNLMEGFIKSIRAIDLLWGESRPKRWEVGIPLVLRLVIE